MPTTTIPSHAAWFSLDDVHDLERRALPEYFSPGSELKTSESYKQARNFIVGTYREQPTLYLSLTECRRHLSLDVAAVMRLHQFLEHWGLINYLSQRPHASGAAGTTVLLDGPASAAVGATAPLVRPLALGCDANLSSRANAYRAAPVAANGDEKEWTPEATMALLEGLEQFDERCAAHAPPPRAAIPPPSPPPRPRPRPRPAPTSTRTPSIPQPPFTPPSVVVAGGRTLPPT
jgi:hypothetical protein